MNAIVSLHDYCILRHYNGTQDIEQAILEEFPMASEWSLSPGKDESNKSKARMQNACGSIVAEDTMPIHRAWKKGPSIFGAVWKAYTLAGNLVLQRKKMSFKGAIKSEDVQRVLHTMLRGQFWVYLQLVVLSIGIGKCIYCHVDCALERRLRYLAWVRVMNRIEEICNVVVFYITDWRAMEKVLCMPPWDDVPKSTTVSVTRRGTLTVRLTWEGTSWNGNEQFYNVTESLAKFVHGLI